MNVWIILLYAWIGCASMMTLLYFYQRRSRDAGIMDVGWAAGLCGLAIYYSLVADGDPLRRGLVGAMAAIWAFRLAAYIFFNRVWNSDREDGRYRRLREYWGDRAQPWFFVFFQVQALWSVMFSLPVLIVLHNPSPALSIWDWAGVIVWAIAVTGETVADRQLAGWRADPAHRGKTCRKGLWRYSRHPNYFFEFVHWWAYVLMASGAPLAWLTLAGPALMFIFLFKITGIPYTERQALASRGDDYRHYQRTTSVFIPWFPKHDPKGAALHENVD